MNGTCKTVAECYIVDIKYNGWIRNSKIFKNNIM